MLKSTSGKMLNTLVTVLDTFVVLSFVTFKGVTGTTCSTTATTHNLPVLAMCTSSLGNGSRLVIDTFDSLSYGKDECVCTGTVKSIISESTKLNISPLTSVQSEPGGNGCGSSIILQSSSTITTRTSTCVLKGSIDVTNNDTITVKWKLNRKDKVLSKYCIYLQLENKDNFSISMTCTAVSVVTSTTTAVTTTTTAVTTTTPSTTTLAPTDHVTTEQKMNSDTTVPDAGDSSTTRGGPKSAGSTDESKGIPIEIVAPAVGGTALIIIIIIVVVIVCKRNKQPDISLTKNAGKPNGDGGGYDNLVAVNMAVDNDDQSGIRKNELYISADDPMIVDSTAANSNNVYAEVQKKPKIDQEKRTNPEQSNAELSNYSTPGPVYAAVNKRNQKQVDEKSTPSRYTSPDGLVYASVDVQSADPSRAPIAPPKRFSDPVPESGRVVYSEIATEL